MASKNANSSLAVWLWYDTGKVFSTIIVTRMMRYEFKLLKVDYESRYKQLFHPPPFLQRLLKNSSSFCSNHASGCGIVCSRQLMHPQTLTSVSKQVGKSSASGPNHGSPPLKLLFSVLYYTAPHLTLKQGFLSFGRVDRKAP